VFREGLAIIKLDSYRAMMAAWFVSFNPTRRSDEYRCISVSAGLSIFETEH